MCVTDHYDMTIAVKVALNPNTTNQPHCFAICFSFRRSCMCSRFTYFLTLIQNEVMVICDWLKSMHMFIQRAPAAILACTFMKTLFTGTANANRSLMALVYTNENNLYQPFSQTTDVRFFQTERVFSFDEIGRNLFKRVENTVGKGEIARFEQFLRFPQCFQI